MSAPPTKAPPAKKPTEDPTPEPEVQSEAEQAATSLTELDVVMPELTAGGTITIAKTSIEPASRNGEAGVEVKCSPVKMRQLLALGRVLTGSTRPLDIYNLLQPIAAAPSKAEQEAALVAAVANLIVTIPHSENEFIHLVATLVDPVTSLTNEEQGELLEYLDNPEAEDVMEVIRQAYTNEAPRMIMLGKQLISLFPKAPDEEKTEETSAQ